MTRKEVAKIIKDAKRKAQQIVLPGRLESINKKIVEKQDKVVMLERQANSDELPPETSAEYNQALADEAEMLMALLDEKSEIEKKLNESKKKKDKKK